MGVAGCPWLLWAPLLTPPQEHVNKLWSRAVQAEAGLAWASQEGWGFQILSVYPALMSYLPGAAWALPQRALCGGAEGQTG